MENFKVEKYGKSMNYCIALAADKIESIQEKTSCLEEQIKLFNYSVSDFMKMLIIEYHAEITFIKQVGLFVVIFDDELNAIEYCKKLNERSANI